MACPSDALRAEPDAFVGEEDDLTESVENVEGRSLRSISDWRVSGSNLVGRSSESAMLQQSFQDVCGPSSKRKIISVHGVSGVGKTALVRGSLRDTVVLQGRGFFVEGKFDQMISKAPFTGVVEALSDLCDVIEQSEDFEKFHKPRIQSKLEASTSQITTILSRLFPRPQLFGTDIEETITMDFRSSPSVDSKRVVSDAFRILVQALASPSKPCVIFLDDVQWANQGSIDVIEALATDPESHNVLFVLAGRDNDPDEDIYVDLMSRISSTESVTDIRLGLLDADNVHDMVCCALHLPPSGSTRALSGVVVDKTLGNPLQVIEYIGSLHRLGFLRHEPCDKWTFDVERIKNKTDVSDSVAAQVGSNLSWLHERTLTILRVAAFLGFNFDIDTLSTVVDYAMGRLAELESAQSHYFVDTLNKCAVTSAIKRCCDQHLVEPMFGKKGHFKFSHDSIQRSLFDSFAKDYENEMMHYHVGKCLNQLEGDVLVFDIADHLNRALGLVRRNRNELLALGKMNIEAASQSMKSLDLSSSSHYGNLALECLRLGNFGWNSTEQNHDLNLAVCNLLAKTSLQLGDFDRCHYFCSEVRANGRCLNETKDALITTSWAFRAQNKQTEAFNFGLAVMSDLNIRVPRSPSILQVLGKLLRVRRLLKRRFGNDASSRYDILEWPESTDERASFVVTMLSHCGMIAHLAEKKTFPIYAGLYIVEQAIKKDVFFADSTSYAFTLYGYIELMFGKEDVAHTYGELVLQMLKRPDNTDTDRSESLFGSACYLVRSKQLVRECIEPCFEAYEMALAKGHLDAAGIILKAHISFAIYSDVNLILLLNRVKRDCLRLKHDYKQENSFLWVSIIWQALLCLIGESESPTKLTGDAMIEEEAFPVAKQSNNEALLASFYGAKLDLEVLFRTITRSKAIAYEYCRRSTALNLIHFGARLSYFAAALTHVDFLRSGVDKRRLARFFRKALRLFRNWKSRGHVNETPYCLVLEAEAAYVSFLKSKTSRYSTDTVLDRIVTLYDRGIVAAKTAGCSRLEAQATERAGRVLIEAGKLPEAREYIAKASELFFEWGAFAKVEDMRSKYAFLEQSLSSPESPCGLIIKSG